MSKLSQENIDAIIKDGEDLFCDIEGWRLQGVIAPSR